MQHLLRVCTICYPFSSFVEISAGSVVDLFKYYEKSETPKRVIGKQCRPTEWSGSPLFANSLDIFLKEYLTSHSLTFNNVPKIEIGLFQYIVWDSLFSLQWVKKTEYLMSFRHSWKDVFCWTFYFKWKSFVLAHHILSETICLFYFCVLFSNIYTKIKFMAKSWSDLCNFNSKGIFWNFS